MHFQVSKTQGKACNTHFRRDVTVSNLDELLDMAHFDHIAGEFKHNYRKLDNFVSADCVIMDCDNDNSEDPQAWLRPEAFARFECFVVFSRNNEKQKKECSPRPRFHIYFPLSKEVTSAAEIRTLKEGIIGLFPQLDEKAKDAARQIFGHGNPTGLAFHGVFVDEVLRGEAVLDNSPQDYDEEDCVSSLADLMSHARLGNSRILKLMYSPAMLRDWPDELAQSYVIVDLYRLAKISGALKPKIPCKAPGCPELVDVGEGGGYCDKHRGLRTAVAPPRESASERGYGRAWQKARKGFLRSHPFCAECLKAGRYVKATDVDHIIPHHGDAKLFWNIRNWQPLCHSCHSKKTRRENH